MQLTRYLFVLLLLTLGLDLVATIRSQEKHPGRQRDDEDESESEADDDDDDDECEEEDEEEEDESDCTTINGVLQCFERMGQSIKHAAENNGLMGRGRAKLDRLRACLMKSEPEDLPARILRTLREVTRIVEVENIMRPKAKNATGGISDIEEVYPHYAKREGAIPSAVVKTVFQGSVVDNQGNFQLSRLARDLFAALREADVPKNTLFHGTGKAAANGGSKKEVLAILQSIAQEGFRYAGTAFHGDGVYFNSSQGLTAGAEAYLKSKHVTYGAIIHAKVFGKRLERRYWHISTKDDDSSVDIHNLYFTGSGDMYGGS